MFQFPHQLQLSGLDLNMNCSYEVGEHFDGAHVTHALSAKQISLYLGFKW